MNYKLYNGDCLEIMKDIPNKSIDMILCDLPYGTTKCKWDVIISFDELWKQYNRIIKDNGAIVLFGSQPFTSKLICSNIDNYKYDWIWDKKKSPNFRGVKYQPLIPYEIISVFNTTKYNPQMTEGKMRGKGKRGYGRGRSGKRNFSNISNTFNTVSDIENEYGTFSNIFQSVLGTAKSQPLRTGANLLIGGAIAGAGVKKGRNYMSKRGGRN